MMTSHEPIRFCASADRTRIAWTRSGQGVPIVRAAHWLTHIEAEPDSPLWGPWIGALAREGQLIRYDERGCGLSDRDVADCSLDAMVADLEAVVEAAGVQRFVLLGTSQGGAIALRYAARHPQRVAKLVLLGAFARGMLRRGLGEAAEERASLMIKMIEVGWGQSSSAFHQAFTTLLMPDAPLRMMQELNELQRISTTPHQAARIFRAVHEFDASEDLARITAPTLVMHVRDDDRVPIAEGRTIAASIGGARFVPLDGRNHVLVEGEAAFARFFVELRAFLRDLRVTGADGGAFATLSERQRQLLELLARGLDNAQIAARIGRSEKTVRNGVSALLGKLAAETRAQAIVKARDAGFGRSSD